MNELLLLAASSGEEVPLYYWLYHDIKEVAVTGIASVILFALLWWKAMPAAKKAMSDRTEKIVAEIGDAEAARTTGEAALADVHGRIANVDTEKNRILAEARSTAEQVKVGLIARGEEEAAAIRARAGADIESAESQVASDLQEEIGRLAIGAAEQVVASSLDPATHSELIDTYIAQMGANA